jgi:hypothetical protein
MRPGVRNALRSLDPTQVGHSDIQDRDVRLRSFRLVHGLAPIRRLGNHAEFRTVFEKQPKTAAHHGVIVS